MTQADSDHVTLRILSQPRYLCAVRALLDAIAQRAGFDEAVRGQMVLAVDEALTNVIRHGYHGADDRPIWLRINPIEAHGDSPGGIHIVIEDECPQVDPTRIAGRDLQDIRPGGLGVHIMKQVMDHVTIEPRDGGRGMRLTMRKYTRRLADRRRSG